MTKIYQNFMKKIMNALIIFACFSIAMPTAWISVASAFLLFTWIISGDYSEKFRVIIKNPAAVSVMILFCLYLIATIYSSGTFKDSSTFLLKYAKLLIIPIIISIAITKKVRDDGMKAFL